MTIQDSEKIFFIKSHIPDPSIVTLKYPIFHLPKIFSMYFKNILITISHLKINNFLYQISSQCPKFSSYLINAFLQLVYLNQDPNKINICIWLMSFDSCKIYDIVPPILFHAILFTEKIWVLAPKNFLIKSLRCLLTGFSISCI